MKAKVQSQMSKEKQELGCAENLCLYTFPFCLELGNHT